MNPEIPEGRLQRRAPNGQHISSFGQVLRRHGSAMTGIAFGGILLTIGSKPLTQTTSDFLSQPLTYLIAGVLLAGFFILFLTIRKWQINKAGGLWITYLLGISIVEEIAFRLTIPVFLMSSLGGFLSILVSNALFAAIHYVTLRWKIIPCVFTFLGGMGLSRLLDNTENIVLVILVHWFFTFLNTPRPPNKFKKAPNA